MTPFVDDGICGECLVGSVCRKRISHRVARTMAMYVEYDLLTFFNVKFDAIST